MVEVEIMDMSCRRNRPYLCRRVEKGSGHRTEGRRILHFLLTMEKVDAMAPISTNMRGTSTEGSQYTSRAACQTPRSLQPCAVQMRGTECSAL